MKKTMAIVLVLSMIASMLMLAACGSDDVDLSDSKYVGTWKCTEMHLGDEITTTDESELDWILTLKGDGTGEYDDEDGSHKITWELTKDGFKTKGDMKLSFTDDGDRIYFSLLGTTVYFEKQ